MSLTNEQVTNRTEQDTFLQGVKDCVPTLLGYLSIGFAAGVIEKTAGLSIMEITLLSLILYAGSAQFIVAAMFAAGGSTSAIIITVFFVNVRHLLLSAALAPYFKHLSTGKNMLIGSLLTDETFGVAITKSAERKYISEKWMHGLNITAYANWIVANIAGAMFGQWISNPETYGLDYALPAMFIGLLVLTMLGRKAFKVDGFIALIAIIVTLIASLFVSASLGVIIATIVASTVGMVISKWK